MAGLVDLFTGDSLRTVVILQAGLGLLSSCFIADPSVALALFGLVAIVQGHQTLVQLVSRSPTVRSVWLQPAEGFWTAAFDLQSNLSPNCLHAHTSVQHSSMVLQSHDVPQFIILNAASIVLDVLRLAIAQHAGGFFLLFILQLAGMLCKVCKGFFLLADTFKSST